VTDGFHLLINGRSCHPCGSRPISHLNYQSSSQKISCDMPVPLIFLVFLYSLPFGSHLLSGKISCRQRLSLSSLLPLASPPPFFYSGAVVPFLLPGWSYRPPVNWACSSVHTSSPRRRAFFFDSTWPMPSFVTFSWRDML